MLTTLANLRQFLRTAMPSREPTVATQAAFAHMGEALIARCRRQHEPLSIVVFELADRGELRSVFGDAAAKLFVTEFCSTLRPLVGTRGAIVRTDAEVFTVLLPGLDRNATFAALRQTFGRTLSIELKAGQDEIVLVPDFLVRTLPNDAMSIAAQQEDMLRSLRRSRALEERRHRYLRKEHESHCTKPVTLGEV